MLKKANSSFRKFNFQFQKYLSQHFNDILFIIKILVLWFWSKYFFRYEWKRVRILFVHKKPTTSERNIIHNLNFNLSLYTNSNWHPTIAKNDIFHCLLKWHSLYRTPHAVNACVKRSSQRSFSDKKSQVYCIIKKFK